MKNLIAIAALLMAPLFVLACDPPQAQAQARRIQFNLIQQSPPVVWQQAQPVQYQYQCSNGQRYLVPVNQPQQYQYVQQPQPVVQYYHAPAPTYTYYAYPQQRSSSIGFSLFRNAGPSCGPGGCSSGR